MIRNALKKSLVIALSVLCFSFGFCGCEVAGQEKIDSNTKTTASEGHTDSARDLFGEWRVKDVKQYESFEKFIEDCPEGTVKSVMSEFPVEDFKQVGFFKVPIPVVRFEDKDKIFYFSGADDNDIFTSYTLNRGLRIFSGKQTGARVTLMPTEIGGPTCLLEYKDGKAQFALTADKVVDPDVYFDILSRITHDEYMYTENENVRIEGNTVEVRYDSYDMAEPNYVLSESGVLKEITCDFVPLYEGEVVVVAEDDTGSGPIGAYHSGSPAKLNLKFEAAANGRTTLEILGENDRVLYSVDFGVDTDKDAFMYARDDLAQSGFYDPRLSIDKSGFIRDTSGDYRMNNDFTIRLESFPTQSDATYGKEEVEARIKELDGDDIRIISVEPSGQRTPRLAYPAWIIEYEYGHKKDKLLCTDVYFQTDTNEYRACLFVSMDKARNYKEEIVRRIASVSLDEI